MPLCCLPRWNTRALGQLAGTSPVLTPEAVEAKAASVPRKERHFEQPRGYAPASPLILAPIPDASSVLVCLSTDNSACPRDLPTQQSAGSTFLFWGHATYRVHWELSQAADSSLVSAVRLFSLKQSLQSRSVINAVPGRTQKSHGAQAPW